MEGETEKVILPFLAEKIGVFNADISVIDCGSKHNLPLYIAVAEAFEIPYLVIHDEDPLPDPMPKDWAEEKKREKHRNPRRKAAAAVGKSSGA
ncbi:MAG: ATP-dependent endonuclease [Thermodesulfobacteriota bacterium]|nr:ATP-dependent endonuclease [Thermodesulfobacteriota bacterium]